MLEQTNATIALQSTQLEQANATVALQDSMLREKEAVIMQQRSKKYFNFYSRRHLTPLE